MKTDEVLQSLLERCRRDQRAWINGDASGYELPDETATIMGGFGGTTVGAATASPGQRGVVAQCQSGTGKVELVNGGWSGDMARLVMIERATVHFVGHGGRSRWELRVTEVFERRGDEWQRVHRQADPLVDRHPLDEVLRLLG